MLVVGATVAVAVGDPAALYLCAEGGWLCWALAHLGKPVPAGLLCLAPGACSLALGWACLPTSRPRRATTHPLFPSCRFT